MSKYKLMPEEATSEMEQAAEKYWNDRKFKALSDDPRTWKGLYAAMRAAAPDVQGGPDIARYDAVRFALSEMVNWYENISLGNNPAFQYYDLAKKALLSAAPQTTPCQECGGDGAGGEHEDDCAMAQHSEQPECGCCGQTVKCDPDCDAVILRRSDQQPAPQTEMLDDDSLARQIGEIGNQIHNLGCEHQNDEGLADRLAEIAHQAWMLQRSVMVSKQQPAPDVAGLVDLLRDIGDVCRQLEVPSERAIAEWADRIDAALAAHRKQGGEV